MGIGGPAAWQAVGSRGRPRGVLRGGAAGEGGKGQERETAHLQGKR